VRRWRRNLTVHCPQIEIQQQNYPLQYQIFLGNISCCTHRVEQQQINREQAAKIIGAIIAEVSFDVNQEGNFSGKTRKFISPTTGD